MDALAISQQFLLPSQKWTFTTKSLPITGKPKKCLSEIDFYDGHKRFKDIQLNSCCVVKRNPACTAFHFTPAFGWACALFCFNNCENSFACELACCGVVCAGTFADVQIWNWNLYLEWACAVRGFWCVMKTPILLNAFIRICITVLNKSKSEQGAPCARTFGFPYRHRV